MAWPADDGEFHEDFHALQLVGFIILVAGTLVYNEIVVIPWYGFDTNTRAAILARKKKEEADDLS